MTTASKRFMEILESATGCNSPPWDIVISPMWDCDGGRNPIGICTYDKGRDPVMDHCLFCGEPYERK